MITYLKSHSKALGFDLQTDMKLWFKVLLFTTFVVSQFGTTVVLGHMDRHTEEEEGQTDAVVRIVILINTYPKLWPSTL